MKTTIINGSLPLQRKGLVTSLEPTEVAFIKYVLGLLIKCLEAVNPFLIYIVILKNVNRFTCRSHGHFDITQVSSNL
ncbi:hypothetical protein PNOK_0437500 [Pyrrhoderma noxium]|uniref:Uncharacterized protein n=1 Tax=Pyrrhoderma noxium TaxID=2282107 RepID=A0A286UIK1_9AGAM|nr:hypothetical protein PNOK_0437500 [Pyrrhoderma noxium]